jgi:hypothetical protein
MYTYIYTVRVPYIKIYDNDNDDNENESQIKDSTRVSHMS